MAAPRVLPLWLLVLCLIGCHDATVYIPTVSTARVVNYNDFLVVRFWMVDPNLAFDVVEVLHTSECRHLCLASGCQAFSVRSLGYDRFECSVTDVSIYSTSWFRPERDSVYYLRRDSQDHLGQDNLVYRRLNTSVVGFNATKAACEKVTGFRMATVRFQEQMPIMLELCLGETPSPASTCTGNSSFYVDMQKVNGQPMVNGQIPLNATNLLSNVSILINGGSESNVFIYGDNLQLHDDIPTLDLLPVCQANPYNVPW
ncbi:uncharacterized protein LOC108681993 [Hyalella azteca]|uniref:Uncharacterized protein LOC108681993 n=1 Tax=Hyalella azteca TaxID=294128 RepID=A0A8B7PKP5_HYAAZ|nr:uncharacterized protein LOC108681993 [Hyalella azteca]